MNRKEYLISLIIIIVLLSISVKIGLKNSLNEVLIIIMLISFLYPSSFATTHISGKLTGDIQSLTFVFICFYVLMFFYFMIIYLVSVKIFLYSLIAFIFTAYIPSYLILDSMFLQFEYLRGTESYEDIVSSWGSIIKNYVVSIICISLLFYINKV